MTEFQEFMLHICFGGMVGFVIGEVIYLIATLVCWIIKKVRKHKEKKQSK